MLCSIDTSTYQWHVRVFPNTTESAFHPLPADTYLPPNWAIDSPLGKPMFTSISWRRDRLQIAGGGYAADAFHHGDIEIDVSRGSDLLA